MSYSVFSHCLEALCHHCLFHRVISGSDRADWLLARQNQADGLSNHRHLHLSHSWSPASSGPRGARVQPRCQTRCYRWSLTPPCLPYLHADRGRVRKQKTGSGDDRERVGEEVRSILIQRGTKTEPFQYLMTSLRIDEKRKAHSPPRHHREVSALHPANRSSPALLHILFPLILWIFPCQFTLTRYDQTSHAVRDAGASRQEGDAHDDIWDPQCETDHSHLKGTKTDKSLPPIPTFKYSVLLLSATRGHTQWCAGFASDVTLWWTR